MEGLLRAGQQASTEQGQSRPNTAAFETFMFLMGITVAHELCHLFVGFIIGWERPATPGNISFLPELYNHTARDGNVIGESGRAWEGWVLGGIVDTFEDPRSPLQARQPGMMYIIDSAKVSRPVPMAKIRALLAVNPQGM